jgi:hypothetical protein
VVDISDPDHLGLRVGEHSRHRQHGELWTQRPALRDTGRAHAAFAGVGILVSDAKRKVALSPTL